MPVDDLWYLSKKDDDDKRVKSSKYGRGKRWRCRYVDEAGEPRTKVFARKTDADDFDAAARLKLAPETQSGQAPSNAGFREYAERWRLSRESGWAVETRRRIESNVRNHLQPVFGNSPMRSITLTVVLEWLATQLADGKPKSSIKLYFELLDAILAAAVTDRLIPDNPCSGVRLSKVLSGVSRVPKWIPTEEEVLRLFDATPERYRAALWLGAGSGLRLAEALGVEEGDRCFGFADNELRVVQQVRYSPQAYGGFYLSLPKAGSSGTIDLDAVVAENVRQHVRDYPPREVDLVDITSGDPIQRQARLLFTTRHGNPINDRTWSREWGKWRTAAGWPEQHGTFHALRHFFATVLISQHVEPQAVQRALRHKTLTITLETYVHWWPRRSQQRGIVGAALMAAAARH
ncbi:tyrosine-type recombinase/integrase [Dactylosporangium sp. NPDC050688]|uniref:site-specific integrase n=1 Tax=Dactylosporangium sp. NPDC050688 TaxID=3157217 RepID=UPI0033D3A89C